jgi:hypothetical protein
MDGHVGIKAEGFEVGADQLFDRLVVIGLGRKPSRPSLCTELWGRKTGAVGSSAMPGTASHAPNRSTASKILSEI